MREEHLPLSSALQRSHLDPLAQARLANEPSAFSRKLDIDPLFWKGAFPPMWTAKSTQPSEYRSEAGVSVESRAYSGAVGQPGMYRMNLPK